MIRYIRQRVLYSMVVLFGVSLLVSGPAITITGGHCHSLGAEVRRIHCR